MNIKFIEKKDPNFEIYKNLIKSNTNLCNSKNQEVVSSSYIKNQSLKNVDIIALNLKEEYKTRSRKTPIITVQGFALLQNRKNYLYIDVICAKQSGDALLSNIYILGNELKKKYVILNALPHVINYYKRDKHKFLHGYKSCEENIEIKKLGESLKNKKFKVPSNATSDKNFQKLLTLLINKKLTYDKTCKTIDSCSKNGYTMTKCI